VDSDIIELDQLNGHRIAVPESGMASMLIEQLYPESTTVGFPTPANTFLALERGMVQAMAGDETTLLGQMSGAPGRYHLLDGFLSDDWLGVGVRKGEPAMLEAVNAALLGMEADGSAAASFDRFFGADTEMQMERNFTISTDNAVAE
jgi:polar amino acid transport system substrate-binding protein